MSASPAFRGRRSCAATLGALLTLAIGPTIAPAQPILSVGSTTVAPGGTGSVNVMLSTSAALQVGSMGLAFDLPAGSGIQFTGITFPTPASQYLFFANSFDQANSLPLGMVVSGNPARVVGNDQANAGAAIVPAAGSVLLARLSFTVAGNVSLGSVPLTIDTQFTELDNAASPPSAIQYTPQNGSILVAAVPEPSTLALTGLVAVGMVCRRRRRATVGKIAPSTPC